MRISEKVAALWPAFGFWLRASAAINADQFDFPSGSRSMEMVGRSSETSAISTLPISNGKNRNRAVSRSAISAGRLASPSTTSPKLTLPLGKSETVALPPSCGSSPVAERMPRSTSARTASGDIR